VSRRLPAAHRKVELIGMSFLDLGRFKKNGFFTWFMGGERRLVAAGVKPVPRPLFAAGPAIAERQAPS
jgi:hypothetical protein